MKPEGYLVAPFPVSAAPAAQADPSQPSSQRRAARYRQFSRNVLYSVLLASQAFTLTTIWYFIVVVVRTDAAFNALGIALLTESLGSLLVALLAPRLHSTAASPARTLLSSPALLTALALLPAIPFVLAPLLHSPDWLLYLSAVFLGPAQAALDHLALKQLQPEWRWVTAGVPGVGVFFASVLFAICSGANAPKNVPFIVSACVLLLPLIFSLLVRQPEAKSPPTHLTPVSGGGMLRLICGRPGAFTALMLAACVSACSVSFFSFKVSRTIDPKYVGCCWLGYSLFLPLFNMFAGGMLAPKPSFSIPQGFLVVFCASLYTAAYVGVVLFDSSHLFYIMTFAALPVADILCWNNVARQALTSLRCAEGEKIAETDSALEDSDVACGLLAYKMAWTLGGAIATWIMPHVSLSWVAVPMLLLTIACLLIFAALQLVRPLWRRALVPQMSFGVLVDSSSTTSLPTIDAHVRSFDLFKLPKSVILAILSLMPPRDVCTFRLVSKKGQHMADTLLDSEEYLKSFYVFVKPPFLNNFTKRPPLSYHRAEGSSLGPSVYSIMVRGLSGVGKTSFVQKWSDTEDQPFAGGIVCRKNSVQAKGRNHIISLFDISSRYEKMNLGSIWKQTIGIFLVFDCTSRDSFTQMVDYRAQCLRFAIPGAVFMLVATKWDLTGRVVSSDEALTWARAYDMEYIEVNPVTGYNVDLAVTRMVEHILDLETPKKEATGLGISSATMELYENSQGRVTRGSSVPARPRVVPKTARTMTSLKLTQKAEIPKSKRTYAPPGDLALVFERITPTALFQILWNLNPEDITRLRASCKFFRMLVDIQLSSDLYRSKYFVPSKPKFLAWNEGTSGSDTAVLTIRGSKGTGKTTFIRAWGGSSIAGSSDLALSAVKTCSQGPSVATIRVYDLPPQKINQENAHWLWKRAKGAFIFVDVTNRKSFEELVWWREECKHFANTPTFCQVIVATHVDDSAHRVVPSSEIFFLAKSLELPCLEIDARNPLHCEMAMNAMLDLLNEQLPNPTQNPSPAGSSSNQVARVWVGARGQQALLGVLVATSLLLLLLL